MATTPIIDKLSAEPEMVEVTSEVGGALLTFVVDEENFTEKQRKELVGVKVNAFVEINDAPIKVATGSALWKGKKDISIIMSRIPKSCKLQFTPIIDKRIIGFEDDEGNTVYEVNPELYVKADVRERAIARQHLETEYDVAVYCDTENVPPSGGMSKNQVQQLIDDTLDNNDVLSYDA